MLTEKDFKLIEKQAIKLYGDLELSIIQEIAERIANVGYANVVAYNSSVILQEMGVLYNDIIKMVAEYNGQTEAEILKIFEEAGINSLKRDDTIYKLAGLNPQGLNESMQQILFATAEKTKRHLDILTQTTASTSQVQFIEALNKAYLEVTTGIKSYNQAILDSIKSISKNGAYIQYPSGAKRSIESATRMNILTSVNQMSGRLQLERGHELGWNLYEVSAHWGARPEHADWQGKVYTEQQLYDICEYGTVTGLCGVNCRHTFTPYYKGSSLTWSNKELTKMRNATVTYNGEKISEYEASQIQRKMERTIRENKKEIAGLTGASNETDVQEELRKVKNQMRQNNATLNDFLEQTGFKKDNTRLVI